MFRLGVSLTLCCFVVYSTRRFVVCLSMCHLVLVFFSPFSIAITSLGEERANLSAFRTFVRFVLVWICRFPLPLWVWEGMRFVIVALPGLFSYFFFSEQSRLAFLTFCLTLKRQEKLHLKLSSVYVVCWIFLQTFQTYFCIPANSMDPDQIWVHTVCKNDF